MRLRLCPSAYAPVLLRLCFCQAAAFASTLEHLMAREEAAQEELRP
jgi:hypothetical protein